LKNFIIYAETQLNFSEAKGSDGLLSEAKKAE